MWVIAAVLSWYLVRRLLIRPLGRLKAAVLAYEPGDERLQLPDRLGPAEEIRELWFSLPARIRAHRRNPNGRWARR